MSCLIKLQPIDKWAEKEGWINFNKINFYQKAGLIVLMVSGLFGCGGGGSSGEVGSASSVNPLATVAQSQLDARAVKIYYSYDFSAEKSKAKNFYSAAYGGFLTPKADAELDAAVDELVFASIQKEVNGDPYRPEVYQLLTPPKKWFGLQVPGGRYAYDNPDAIYRWIPISGGERYILRGHRHTNGPSDVTFSLIDNVNSQGTINYLSDADLVIDSNGNYTVTVDSDPANGRINHIRSTSAAVQLFVRNNLGDWSTQVPDSLAVERISTTAAPPAKTDAAIFAAASQALLAGGATYGTYLLGATTLATPVNTIPVPKVGSGLITQANSFSHFRVADDEALVITLNAGGAGYFVVPVTTLWMGSVKPETHQSSLNSSQAIANADGTYTFVLSPTDPGIFNWLDTVGLNEGTIMLRLQRLPLLATNISVQSRLVKLTELPGILPAGTRHVSASERQQILASRAAGFARRLAEPIP